jgi:hypothetical protein
MRRLGFISAVVLLVAGSGAVAAFLMSVGDIKRYLKIRNM